MHCFVVGFAHRTSQDVAPVVATHSVLVGVNDESCISSPEDGKFHDVGVQTDFAGEKLPEGFVPYTKHRSLALLEFFLFVAICAYRSSINSAPVENLGFTCAT